MPSLWPPSALEPNSEMMRPCTGQRKLLPDIGSGCGSCSVLVPEAFAVAIAVLVSGVLGSAGLDSAVLVGEPPPITSSDAAIVGFAALALSSDTDCVGAGEGSDGLLASATSGAGVSCFALGMIRVWLIWSRSARVSLFAAINSFSVILNLLAMPRGVSPLC